MKNLIVPTLGEAPLDLLRRCGGWYECPKDPTGKRLGPLVGYAGRDSQGRQFVGDIYANFPSIEEHPQALSHVAGLFEDLPFDFDSIGTFCAMPMGGILLGGALSQAFNTRCIFPEKRTIAVATTDSREKSELFFGRHAIRPGESLGIVEDVFNNASTTAEAIRLIEALGGRVTCIICFLNRSLRMDREFLTVDYCIPVVALVRKPIEQYEQDDLAVAADIAAGNVIWKPKNEWAKLEEAMACQQAFYQHEQGDDGP